VRAIFWTKEWVWIRIFGATIKRFPALWVRFTCEGGETHRMGGEKGSLQEGGQDNSSIQKKITAFGGPFQTARGEPGRGQARGRGMFEFLFETKRKT